MKILRDSIRTHRLINKLRTQIKLREKQLTESELKYKSMSSFYVDEKLKFWDKINRLERYIKSLP